jgi:ankyrin repeat protein
MATSATLQALLKTNPALTSVHDAYATPLHYAVFMGQKAAVELLLADHADVNATDDNGKTPLRIALVSHRNLTELLRQHGGHN